MPYTEITSYLSWEYLYPWPFDIASKEGNITSKDTHMYYGRDTIFIYDDTFEGLLSAVFDAYDMKCTPADITVSEEGQQSIGTELYYVNTSAEKSDRVMAGMQKKIGGGFVGMVENAYLSWQPGREMAIYRYIVLGFKLGPRIELNLSDETVLKIKSYASLVGREVNKLTGFIRFSVMENNVMYAQISPESNCLAFFMPHFADRMRGIPFLIHDLTHHLIGVCNTAEWYIRTDEGLTLPKYSADEMLYRRMWKTFYNTIAVEGRVNKKLRQHFMPLRYQKHMTEMQDDPFLDQLDTESAKPAVGDGNGNGDGDQCHQAIV